MDNAAAMQLSLTDALTLLKGGRASIHEWNDRKRRGAQVPSLAGVNFREVDLGGADLSGMNLSKAIMSGANLAEANLANADLAGAYLIDAVLSSANKSGGSDREYMMLFNTSLNGARLVGADLSAAFIEQGQLDGADLTDANLRKTDLAAASLKGATLKRAILAGANLALANLELADLESANLSTANLSAAELAGARLHDALLYRTVFVDTDLSAVEGLSLVRFYAASYVDRMTLLKSRALPLEFLRGCGLSDWEIEATRLYDEALNLEQQNQVLYDVQAKLQGQPLRFDSVFISYSGADEHFAMRLHASLQAAGVRCWFAPRDIQGGKKLYDQIGGAIHSHDRLLLILSDSSMKSGWVGTEIALGRQREREEKRRVLFPIRLVSMESIEQWVCFDADSGTDSAREIREYFLPDFSGWRDSRNYHAVFERLLSDLRA